MVLRFAGRAQHSLAILVNHLTNLPRMQSRLRANVGNGAAQAYIVADEINSARILQQIIDVGLPNAKASVDIATIVRFCAISHVPYSVSKSRSLLSGYACSVASVRPHCSRVEE
jgi:hypothetical protein